MKISGLTIVLIIITLSSLIIVGLDRQVLNFSHSTSDKLFDMIMEQNNSNETQNILEDAYTNIKNIELNQRTNANVAGLRFIILLIFTLFSYKIDIMVKK